MPLTKKILVVDDDPGVLSLIKDILSSAGYQVTPCQSASQALVQMKKDTPHVLITDLHMKEIDGMMLLKKVQADFPNVVCIMMTAFGTIETAVEATKLGAYHYLVKPFKMDELLILVKRAFERSQLQQQNVLLRKQIKKEYSIDSMIGQSRPMAELFDLVKRVAPASANVLINGESGSGKELVARAIHNLGPRRDGPFIPINCTAIPEPLLESELFGHVKGSFTGATTNKKGLFEEAHGGTLFLDEIGDMNLALQAKLLRVLQDKAIRSVGSSEFKEVDVRLIAATHRDLKTMVKEGKFREDLFYRLNVIPVRVPPLRERQQDIPLLVEHFIQKFSALNGFPPKGIAQEAMTKLLAYPWPGNVRELENVMERAVVLSVGPELTVSDVMGSALESAKESFQQLFSDSPTLENLEERYIKLVLAQVGHKKEKAAQILGINRRTLYRKERLYGLVSDDTPEPEEHDEAPAPSF